MFCLFEEIKYINLGNLKSLYFSLKQQQQQYVMTLGDIIIIYQSQGPHSIDLMAMQRVL